MIEAMFWTALGLLVYTYLGYPLLVALASLCRRLDRPTVEAFPFVSIVVVAHNEASRIAARLDNLTALTYPSDRCEIILASDGSTDGTVEVACTRASHGVSVMDFPGRRGKPAVLNDVIPAVRGEIVVLVDARQHFDPGTLAALVAPFADSGVGAVSGELILDEPTGAAIGDGVGFYWRYEKFIRKHESRLDSTIGATGAIYAIRRRLFESIAPDTLLDDVLIPLRIVRRGYRVLFESAARAYDCAALTPAEERTRKLRTIAGNFQLFVRETWLLNPFANRLWWQTISHKGLRLLGPGMLLIVLATNVLLLHRVGYRWAMAGQVLFYLSALLGYLLRNAPRRVRLLSVSYVFCLLNWVTVLAFVRFASGRQAVTWERASGWGRSPSASPLASPAPGTLDRQGSRGRRATTWRR